MNSRRKLAPNVPLVSSAGSIACSYKNSLVANDPPAEVHSPRLPPQLAFDNTLLNAYHLSDTSENRSLVNLVQTLYQNGSDNLKSGLHKLVSSMIDSATQSSAINQELCEKYQKISELESRIVTMESASESNIEMLHERIKERDNQYESLASMVSDMSSQAATALQLRHDKETLQCQMDDLKGQLLSKRKRMEDLSGKEAILVRVTKMFDDPATGKPIQYPVIQQNGVIVDLYRVIMAWTKQSNDDDDHPYRNYICPITRSQTSLARIGIVSKIQEIALELGRDLTPPIEFEFKNLADRWIKFGLMDQLRILAKISCMYVNNISASAIMVKNDQICFDIMLERNGRDLSLKCKAQDKGTSSTLEVRIHINEQNPFPEITQIQA